VPWFLGIHIGHDRSAAVIRDGRLIAHIAEERLDRVKYSNSPNLPVLSVRTLIDYLALDLRDLRAVGISYTNVHIESILPQLTDEIRDALGMRHVEVVGCAHHRAHALSAFHTSTNEEALVLIADGAGDIVGGRLEAETLFFADRTGLRVLESRTQDFPTTRLDRRNAFNPAYFLEADADKSISIGRKYEQFTYLIGFRHGEAGKTMGLAAYDVPLFDPEVRDFSGIASDLRFADYLSRIEELSKAAGEAWHVFVRERRQAIAALAQAIAEKHVLRMLANVRKTFGARPLCVAGGLFLNCRLNHAILEQSPFDKLHMIPTAGDDGQAIGAAFHAALEHSAEIPKSSGSFPYLGLSYSTDEIAAAVAHFGFPYRRLPANLLVRQIARDLEAGKTVGLLRGRSESGPRALCHRSILANPCFSEIRDDLNRLKGRESFRPFAPVVTADSQFTYFDLRSSSPFMLLACNVRPEYRTALAGITHVDGTARVQAVDEATESFIHALLKEFEHLSGFPILLNTSFNLAGEPLVEHPHDALSTFAASSLDVLVMEDFYITSRMPVRIRKSA
jgi:carbamoyltransferase